ncbi:MAG: hypothetical protein P4L53_19810 [Candidatus Obscuribacterales bacterium]|nr:hypothetical protein [Candidatus Obscuribacterales bacterium]
MGIYIGMLEFDGPNIVASDLVDKPGVYALVHQFPGDFELLSVGHSESLYRSGQCIDIDELQKEHLGSISFAIFETDLPERARTSIVRAIELEFDGETSIMPQLERDMSRQFSL